MKKINLLFIACFCIWNSSFSQNAQVEKSIFGIQTGLLGIWVHNEARLAPKIALRSEIGFDAGFWISSYKEDGFAMIPTITLEPRYYYNLEKREAKGKKVHHNAANFLSLDVNYIPNWFVISNVDNVEVVETISFIPKWGIRRNIGQHLITK